MQLALHQAREALDGGEFPVGCVIEHQGEVVATGRRVNSIGKVNEMDHAEMVALRALLDSEYQLNLAKVTVYSTMEPCLMCFTTLLVNGVRNFVFGYEDAMGGGTKLPLNMLPPLYSDLKVNVVGGVLRKQSLQLFQEFFSAPDNEYLKNSLLESYTLKQK